ncbi:hypothetical protein B0H67DRAFT_638171 [Lasiosphaeris hirsuta]|uniref:HNH nuclease domain-containing protein n=1 Tax=Lasiosphaeris hirsuta TaxID=260670 RepID=A0AA40B8E4_9PEZI|nr:hypothetical protein B0H67DRAFT_638171 [Lasiosphaeris hirsuta]
MGQFKVKGVRRAAYLYNWHQVDSIDVIFDPGARNEIFSPLNGLFLQEKYEDAQDRGFLAIVPDVDLNTLDPKPPSIPYAQKMGMSIPTLKGQSNLRVWQTSLKRILRLERLNAHIEKRVAY